MSDITSQTDMDDLRSVTASIYTDTSITFIEDGDIVLRDGYILTTPGLLSTTSTGSFTANNCIINILDDRIGGNNTAWEGGDLTLTNSQLVYTHDGGSQAFPGFAVASQSDRPTYNFAGSTIINYNGGNLTNHFGNMSLTGSNFTGLTFASGAVFIPFGAVPLVSVTFSSGADTSSSVTGLVYYRLNRATSGGAPKLTAAFTGFFNCDLTAWDDTSRSVTQAVQTGDSDFTTLSVYFVDGTFSDSWRNNGGVHLRNTSLDGNSKEQINYSGQSFLPAFYTTATTTEVTDVVYDAGDRTIHLMLAEGTDNTTLPEIVPQIGSNNYVTYYDSGTARPGIMFQQATSTVSGDNTLVTLDIDYDTITDIPYWSYTNGCYTNGSVDTLNHSRATLTGDMILDSTIVDITFMAAETILNGNTEANAIAKVASGITSGNDTYACLKYFSYNDRLTSIGFSIAGDVMALGTTTFGSDEEFAVSSSATHIKTSNLTGGDVTRKYTGDIFSATSAVGLADIQLDYSTSIALDNITETDSGNEFKAPTITNTPLIIRGRYENDNTLAFVGGNTTTAESNINSAVSIAGTAKNTLGGTINGTVTSTGGDIDFIGPVDEIGGLTTGDISLDSITLITADFKSGHTTNGIIVASTATNLVLDGTHDKDVTRLIGTATTVANGRAKGVLTLGDGVFTSGEDFIADETVTAGDGDHSVDGIIRKAVTLGNGDSTVDAEIQAGGLDMGTGHQTVNGVVTGAVVSDGRLTTDVNSQLSSTVTAQNGISSIGGTIGGNVSLGTGASTSSADVTGTFITSGTLTTDAGFSTTGLLTAAGAGESSIDGSIGDKLTLGDAGTDNHTVAATILNNGGLEMGTGVGHIVSGNVTGAVTTTGTLVTEESFQCDSTVTANTATGDSIISSNSTGIDGKVTLGNAENSHTVSATITAGGLELGTGTNKHSISGNIVGRVLSLGILETSPTFQCNDSIAAISPTGDSVIDTNDDGITGNVDLGDASVGHSFPGKTAAKLIMGAGAHGVDGTVSGTLDTIGSLTTGATFVGGDAVTVGNTAASTLIAFGANGVGSFNRSIITGFGTETIRTGNDRTNLAFTNTFTGNVPDIDDRTIDSLDTIAIRYRGTSTDSLSLRITDWVSQINAESTFEFTAYGTATSIILVAKTSIPVYSGLGVGTANNNYTATLSAANIADADSNIGSSATGIGGKVTLGNAATQHTVSATITAGGLEMGNGTHTISSTANITGAVSMGAGAQTTDGTIDGTLTMGTGVKTLNGIVKGAVSTTGSLNTGLVSNCQSTVTSTANSSSIINGTLGGKLTLADANHTVGATITTGGMTLGTGDHTIDATITGPVVLGAGASTINGTYVGDMTVGAGNTALGGSITGAVTLGNGNHTVTTTSLSELLQTGNGDTVIDGTISAITDGTGTLTFAAGTVVTGLITKSGDGASNGLIVDAAFDTSNPLTVPSGTLDVFGVPSWVGTVTGNVNFILDPTNTSFEIPAGLPPGRVLLRNLTDNVNTSDVEYVGSKIVLGSFVNVPTGAKDYRIYYKATNTYGSNGVFYLTTIANGSNNNTADTIVSVVRADHPNVLTVAAELADIDGLTATMSLPANPVAPSVKHTSEITITGTTDQIFGPQTQALLMRVTDDVSYLNLMANNEDTVDYILPVVQSGTTIDRGVLTLTATDQQSITAVNGVGTSEGELVADFTAGGKSFTSVFIFPNPLGITIPEVIVAVDDSATAGRVKDMRGNELLGLAPQDEDNN